MMRINEVDDNANKGNAGNITNTCRNKFHTRRCFVSKFNSFATIAIVSVIKHRVVLGCGYANYSFNDHGCLIQEQI